MKDTAKVLEDKATKKFKKAETNKDMSLVTQGNALKDLQERVKLQQQTWKILL